MILLICVNYKTCHTRSIDLCAKINPQKKQPWILMSENLRTRSSFVYFCLDAETGRDDNDAWPTHWLTMNHRTCTQWLTQNQLAKDWGIIPLWKLTKFVFNVYVPSNGQVYILRIHLLFLILFWVKNRVCNNYTY